MKEGSFKQLIGMHVKLLIGAVPQARLGVCGGIDMKIGIVEDEAVWRNKIQAVIENYCRDKNISFQINSYGSGKDFMENPDADLLFLDIELAEGEDGFGIAD